MSDLLTLAPSVGVFAGNPNGTVTGAQGAILRDSTNALLWINTTGGTVWLALIRSDQLTPSSPFSFGTGSDGPAVFDGVTAVTGCSGPSSGVYTMTRHCYWTTGVGSGGAVLKTDGYIYLFSDGSTGLSGTLIIDSSGGAGTQGLQGATPWSSARPLPNGAAGGIAGTLNAGASATAIRYAVITATTGGALGPNAGQTGGVLHGGSGGGGAGGAGGNGGDVTLALQTLGDWELFSNASMGRQDGTAGGSARAAFSCGSGGGGGGINGVDSAGGGGSGGYQVGFVRKITGSGITFRSRGGNGAAGVPSGGGFAGGGGAGGSGGIVVLIIGPGVTSPTPDVAGGTGGTASGGAVGAGNGGNGGPGKFVIYQ